jgi:hypothetical protein
MIKPTKKFPKFKLENAQTMVEFAIVFPIILLITYGLIEFGRMIFIYAAVTNAAREGARYGIAAGDIGGVPQYADCQGIRDAVRKTAFLVSIPDINIDISYDNGPDLPRVVVASTCEELAGKVLANNNPIKLGDRIKVTVRARYNPVIGRFLGIGGYDITKINFRTILLNVIVK